MSFIRDGKEGTFLKLGIQNASQVKFKCAKNKGRAKLELIFDKLKVQSLKQLQKELLPLQGTPPFLFNNENLKLKC